MPTSHPSRKMRFIEIILEDLKRQYHFAGRPQANVGVFKLFLALGNVRFLPVLVHRLAHAFYIWHLEPFARGLSLINFVVFGTEISMRCPIGPGLYFPHTSGTVLGAQEIGSNAVIYHQVTLGAKEMDVGYSEGKRPILGDNVTICSGAKVLGGITIGNNVVIAANAVVVKSVPDNVLVGGIPAEIIKDIPTRGSA